MLFFQCNKYGRVAHQDRAQDSYVRLGASLETVNVELLKVEETCKMAISSQASKDEGVETRRVASKGSPSYDEGIVQRTNTPIGAVVKTIV